MDKKVLFSGKLIKEIHKHSNFYKCTPEQKQQMYDSYGERVFDITRVVLKCNAIEHRPVSLTYLVSDATNTENPFSLKRFDPFINKHVIITGEVQLSKYLYVTTINLDRTSDTYISNG